MPEISVWQEGSKLGEIGVGRKEDKSKGNMMKVFCKTRKPSFGFWLNPGQSDEVEIRFGAKGAANYTCRFKLFDFANLNVEMWCPLQQLGTQQPGGKAQVGVWFSPKHATEAPPAYLTGAPAPPPAAGGLMAQVTPIGGRSIVHLTVHSATGLKAKNRASMFSSKTVDSRVGKG